MKTVLIVIGGMGDLPDPMTLRETPLKEATIPSLDMLARLGRLSSFPTYYEEQEISHKNSLLSIMGFNPGAGEPSIEELMEFGLDNSSPITRYPTLRPLIIPGFSGHGVCITTSAWARGVAKCAMLKPLDIYSPGSSDAEILETEAKLVIDSLTKNEFIFVYIDLPLKASMRGDYKEKIRALEIIDRHFINPVADFAWKSDLLIQIAITTDLTTPWHRRRPTKIGVPIILYFNGEDIEEDSEMAFNEVQAMLSPKMFSEPADLIRYLSDFQINY